MKRSAYEITLAAPASCDFVEIMDWSAQHFGVAAADRYEELIGQALIDLSEDPFRPTARQRPGLPEGVYLYHLAGSRERVVGEPVKAPRHFLLYRVVSTRVEVLRMLHDNRDLTRHLPEA